MTVPEIAQILRIGRNKAYELISKGKINSMKLGGKIIIPKMCLVAFLMNTDNYRTQSNSDSEELKVFGSMCSLICNTDGTAESIQ